MSEETVEKSFNPIAPPMPAIPLIQEVKPEPPLMPLPKAYVEKKILQLSTWRGSQSQFKVDVRGWFARLIVTEVVAMTQSESDGNVNVTIVYR